MNKYWRWTPWIVLVAVAVTLLAIGSHRSSHPTLDAQVMHIANEVRCPVCDGETAAQSSAAASVQIRSDIRQELLAGQSSDQILAGLVRSYGPGILEKPQSSGVGLIVWVVPVVATVLAAAAMAWAFVRWRRRARPAGGDRDERSGPAEAPSSLVAVGAPVPGGASLDEALATVVAPAATAVSVQSSGSSPGSPAPDPARRPEARLGASPDPEARLGASPDPEAARPERPAHRRQRWVRATVIGVGVCLIAGGAGWAVAESSNTRLPGQPVTGQTLGSQAIAQDMQAAQTDAAKGNAVAAIKEYQKILQTDPGQVDALTGEGWLLVQTAEPSLLQQGIQLLASAEQSDPGYAPAHLYRGMAFMSEADYSDAVTELQWYLGHQPDPVVAPEVRQDLQEAEASAKAASGAAKS